LKGQGSCKFMLNMVSLRRSTRADLLELVGLEEDRQRFTTHFMVDAEQTTAAWSRESCTTGRPEEDGARPGVEMETDLDRLRFGQDKFVHFVPKLGWILKNGSAASSLSVRDETHSSIGVHSCSEECSSFATDTTSLTKIGSRPSTRAIF